MQTTSTPAWTLADRLRKARVDAGYRSQTALALAIGVTRNTIGNGESGAHVPHRLVMEKWAAACAVSYEWLVNGEAGAPVTLAKPHSSRDARKHRRITGIRVMPDISASEAA